MLEDIDDITTNNQPNMSASEASRNKPTSSKINKIENGLESSRCPWIVWKNSPIPQVNAQNPQTQIPEAVKRRSSEDDNVQGGVNNVGATHFFYHYATSTSLLSLISNHPSFIIESKVET